MLIRSLGIQKLSTKKLEKLGKLDGGMLERWFDQKPEGEAWCAFTNSRSGWYFYLNVMSSIVLVANQQLR